MSPGNQGVFQLMKEVTFRRILAFCIAYSDSRLQEAGLIKKLKYIL